jgi:tetratricopeptide (TPR) repeat protein
MMTILIGGTNEVRPERRKATVATQEDRLAAIAAAAAAVLRQTPYHVVRAGDVAAAVKLSGQTGRSAVWLYNEVHNRRVLVALAAADAWREFPGRVSWSAPEPIESVTAARSAVVLALGTIVAFHRAEYQLMTQVGYGIGDISTAEKRQLAAGDGPAPPEWPDSPWGRVAAAGWRGGCDVFSDFLRPVLRACAESVTYLTKPTLAESASRLSDITFRTCLADREGPVELVARGLAALWFERDLTRVAGALARDLESSEITLAAVARRHTDPRAEANASAVVVRVLLEAGTLHARGVREARRTVSLWQALTADLDAQAAPLPDAAGHDLQRLSDAASHLGMAASRYGDWRSAAAAWELSRQVATQRLGDDRSRIARADNNLAELAAETGRGRDAATLIAGVQHTRLGMLERQPQDAAAWRRLTVTERTRTEIARINGNVIDSVTLASDLLTDRQARLGHLAHADTAEARAVLGQALLSAGHPVVARRHLEEAAAVRRGRFLLTSHQVQEDLTWLARVALVLERPRTVLELLGDEAALTDWFRDRVSFRLGYTARRLLALAHGRLGRVEEAIAALLADQEQLANWPLDPGLDPLTADIERSLGELALMRSEATGATGAAAALGRLADAEAAVGVGVGVGVGRVGGGGATGPPLPGRGWTLVLLGRAADRLGDTGRVAECFRSVIALAGDGIDACHPVILTARYDEAVRYAARGEASQAGRLLSPVLDRTLLAHGRPALGEGHPLLARARNLAERLGITVPDSAADPAEASLDIDV